MHLRRLVKGNALRALRRHWSRAAAISLILMILSQFFVSLEFLLSVIFDIPDFADPLRTPQTYLDDLPNAAPAAVAPVSYTHLDVYKRQAQRDHSNLLVHRLSSVSDNSPRLAFCRTPRAIEAG